jgi:integrase
MTLGRFDPLGEMEGEPTLGGPLTLMAARRLATEILRQRALGKDVIGDAMSAKRRRRSEVSDRERQNFAVVAKRYVEEYAKPRTKSWSTTARVLGFKPKTLDLLTGGLAHRWASKPVGEVTSNDIHDLIDDVYARGVPGLRTRTVMSDPTARMALLRYNSFFSWCVERRLVDRNPCDGVARPPPGASRERTLTDDELRLLWQACEGVGEPFGAALRLLLVTGQRRGEVGGMRWDELSEDRETWTISANRVKNNRQHVVPLSWLARDVIASVRRVEGPFVFTTDGRTHAAGWSKIKLRLDARMRELAGGAVPGWVVHDIRRTVATGLQKLGVRLEVTESILNHTSGSRAGVVGIYQRYAFEPEKRAALTAWANHVEKITA